jgi:ribosomal protein L29
MKKSAKADLRTKSAEDLRKQADEIRIDMLKVRLSQAAKGERRGLSYRNQRRQIARLVTIAAELASAAK